MGIIVVSLPCTAYHWGAFIALCSIHAKVILYLIQKFRSESLLSVLCEGAGLAFEY